MRRLLATAAVIASPLVAEDMVWRGYDGSFEDAAFAVEQAIVGQGLVIEFTSHVSEMLARTAADVGAEGSPFEAGEVYLFCSATVSRAAMEADPANIVYCPYGIAVQQVGDAVRIGRQDYPPASMDVVEEMIDAIIDEAAAF